MDLLIQSMLLELNADTFYIYMWKTVVLYVLNLILH